MTSLTGRTQIAHLLRRAGFGATESELDAYEKLGFADSVEQLLKPEEVNDPLDQQIAAANPDTSTLTNISQLWLYRMIHTKRPLQEKMTLFWHGHFATGIQKVKSPQLMWKQNETFRRLGLAKFYDLVLAVSQDPAMLIWLDNRTNKKAAPNENYGRELMELFTLGIGNYTEFDVRAAARAFTGWFVHRKRTADSKHPIDGSFFFNARQHDDGQKTFLGQTGNWNGDDIIRIILSKPASDTFIATKLFSYFVWDNPDPKTVAPFAEAFAKSDHDIRALIRTIFLSPEFSSEQALRAKIKSPAEYVAGLMKAFNVARPPALAVGSMTLQGQQLFNPPNVGGWPGGLSWVSTNSLLERYNFANYLLTGESELNLKSRKGLTKAKVPKSGHALVDATQLLGANSSMTPDQLVDASLHLLLDGDATAEQRNALIAYLKLDDHGKTGNFVWNPQTVASKLPGVVHLTITIPAYQTA